MEPASACPVDHLSLVIANAPGTIAAIAAFVAAIQGRDTARRVAGRVADWIDGASDQREHDRGPGDPPRWRDVQ